MSKPDHFDQAAITLGRLLEDQMAATMSEPVAYVLVIRPLSGPGSLASNMPLGDAMKTLQSSLTALEQQAQLDKRRSVN